MTGGRTRRDKFCYHRDKIPFHRLRKINVIGLHKKFRDISQEAGEISYETLNLLAVLNRNSRLLLGASGTLR